MTTMSAALRRALLVPTIFMLAAMTVLVGLGVWQWQRKAWKEEVIATIAARSKAAPVDAGEWLKRPCPPAAQAGLHASCEYIAVKLTGVFDHANERHVYTGIAAMPGGVGGQGYWILTPMKLTSGAVIAVSRGFVPEQKKTPGARAAGQIDGETTVIGLVREAEPRATFTATNDAVKNMWFLRNPGELFGDGKAGVSRLDAFIDLLSPMPPGGLPSPTAGRIDIPNRHLEYALTWWGLALTLAGVYAAFVATQLKASRGD